MRTIALLIIIATITLAGCEQATTPQDCYGICDEITAETPTPECEETYCAFDVRFASSNYHKIKYVSGKPILSELDATDCDKIFEEQHNATAYLCKIQHATMLKPAGRPQGKDAWQWQLDCACSYQP